ncbi:MarR family transcriptional regulator [Micromonospora sp. DR5-3]|uniref:MarR family winged helix-turn-helix transcriptional regulator n=1 Tax=unclassified Micromonospora TaxID=2617518 RepID=UPI0011DB2C2B|nr:MULTISPECIES: MarR family transcriptional regulator [unclassified Micromonospora]MCW3818041.1 MarR family transcriptional regulator [Micromonospora sp. DR5-3]TYC26340.1 MarR family transcriptional regulator [Micromonospora sp. MP36]
MAADDVDVIVEQWRRERAGMRPEPMAVFGRIYRLARLVGDSQEKVYAGWGISRGEFDVLAALRRAGEPYTLAPKALAASLMLTSGGMTGRLDRLERAGLVRRSPDPEDRRGLRVSLTDTGRRVVEESADAGLEVQRRLLDALPPADQERLGDLLRALLSAAETGR